MKSLHRQKQVQKEKQAREVLAKELLELKRAATEEQINIIQLKKLPSCQRMRKGSTTFAKLIEYRGTSPAEVIEKIKDKWKLACQYEMRAE